MNIKVFFPSPSESLKKSTSVANASVGEDSSEGTISCVEFHIWDNMMQHKFSMKDKENQSQGSWLKKLSPRTSHISLEIFQDDGIGGEGRSEALLPRLHGLEDSKKPLGYTYMNWTLKDSLKTEI